MTSIPNLPKTYKAASFEAKNAPLTIKDIELKLPGPGQVLVKVIATGVCHTDMTVQNGNLGNSFPIIPGHEIIGEVAAIPEGEKKWKLGDCVGGGWHGGHDGSCRSCQRGYFQICANEAINGVTIDGGYAEFVLLRTEAVVRVPKGVDPVTYCPILCAGVTTYNSMRRLNVPSGELVAIEGLGGLGHLALQYAHKMGYRVVAISHGDSKHQFAQELGAHEYIDSTQGDVAKQLQAMGGAAMIVATAPHPESISPLIYGLQPLGHLLVLSPIGKIEVDTNFLVQYGATVSSYPSGHALDSEEALDYTKLHDVKCLVEPFPLKDAQKAYDHMLSGKVRFRSVLVMDK